MTYEFIDHTADIGLKVCENSIEKVFITAARGMTQILISGDIACTESVTIDLQADSWEELFHDWLSEVNYLFSTKEMLLQEFTITELESKRLHAVCKGETYNPARHTYLKEIKAVTYHQLAIVKQKNQWYAKVFFDV